MDSSAVSIPCADGFTLHATVHSARHPARALVLLHPATGVTERMYFAFARYLAEQGFQAVTYNYRGVGAGAREVSAGFSTWAQYDVEGVTSWATAQYPELPLFAIGHSFGGHAIGLCATSQQLEGAVMIASQAGCLRFITPLAERLRVAALLKVIGPLCARLLGYVPGKKLGIGEDLPAQVMLEWCRWTSLPRYFFDDPGMNATARFSRPRMPVLAIGLDDDPWAPPAAIDLICQQLTGCQVERRQLNPAHSNGQAIGHMGFFRDRHADTLWPGIAAWLQQRLEATP